MSRHCSVCNHPDHLAIDKDLVGDVAYAEVARRYSLHYKAVERHYKNGHIAEDVKAAIESGRLENGIEVAKCAREIYDIAISSAKLARESGMYQAVGPCLAPATKVWDVVRRVDDHDTDNDRPGIDWAIAEMKARNDARQQQ